MLLFNSLQFLSILLTQPLYLFCSWLLYILGPHDWFDCHYCPLHARKLNRGSSFAHRSSLFPLDLTANGFHQLKLSTHVNSIHTLRYRYYFPYPLRLSYRLSLDWGISLAFRCWFHAGIVSANGFAIPCFDVKRLYTKAERIQHHGETKILGMISLHPRLCSHGSSSAPSPAYQIAVDRQNRRVSDDVDVRECLILHPCLDWLSRQFLLCYF